MERIATGKRSVRILLVALSVIAAIALCAWAAGGPERNQPAATAKKAPTKDEKPTQTAASPQTQTQSADDDVPVLIEEKPTSKNATTISTPLGVQEGSQRRHETITRIENKAKHDALETRHELEKSETAQDDAENTAKDTQTQAEDKKPPQL